MKYIDDEEKELIESYNKGNWESVENEGQQKYIDAAKYSTVSNRVNPGITVRTIM